MFRGIDSDRTPESGMGPMWLTDGNNFVIRKGRIEPRPGYASAGITGLVGRPCASLTLAFKTQLREDLLIATTRTNIPEIQRHYIVRSSSAALVGQFSLPTQVRPVFVDAGTRTFAEPGQPAVTGRYVFAGTGAQEAMPGSGMGGVMAYVIDQTSVYPIPPGLPRPGTKPTVDAATVDAAGSLTGAFSYKTSWYRSSDAMESAPSDESSPIQLTSQRHTITRAAAYPSVGTPDKWRIYRKRIGTTLVGEIDETGAAISVGDGVGADDDWYLVVEKAYTATTHVDDCSDGQLGTERVRVNNLPPPPYAQYLCSHRGRMFYATVNSATFYYSELPDPVRGYQYEFVGQYSYVTMPFFEKGEVITGLWSFGQSLIVFSQFHAYRVSGTETLASTDPTIDRLNGAAGCHCHWAIREIPETAATPGLLIYPNNNGAYVFDGQGTRCLSRNPEGGGIVSTFNGLTKGKGVEQGFRSWYWASAIIDPVTLEYLLSCSTYTNATDDNDLILVYSIDQAAWSKWTLASTLLERTERGSGYEASYLFNSAGTLELGNARSQHYTDSGAPFNMEAQFVRQFVPATDKSKFLQFWVQWDRVPGATTLYVGVDDGTATSTSNTVSRAAPAVAKRFVSRYPLEVTGERVTLRVRKAITAASGSDWAAICGFGIDTEPLGVRP